MALPRPVAELLGVFVVAALPIQTYGVRQSTSVPNLTLTVSIIVNKHIFVAEFGFLKD